MHVNFFQMFVLIGIELIKDEVFLTFLKVSCKMPTFHSVKSTILFNMHSEVRTLETPLHSIKLLLWIRNGCNDQASLWSAIINSSWLQTNTPCRIVLKWKCAKSYCALRIKEMLVEVMYAPYQSSSPIWKMLYKHVLWCHYFIILSVSVSNVFPV